MTEIYIDNAALETGATDIRVFGKWTGSDIQISDISLEVNRTILKLFSYEFVFHFNLGLHSWR